MLKHNRTQLLYLCAIIVALGLTYLVLYKSGIVGFLQHVPSLKEWIQQQGSIGPLVIIGLMIVAITMSPIPSAPIALAAGALYGHTIGTIYIVIGSVTGSTVAFFVSRISGIDVTRKWSGNNSWKVLIGSQKVGS